VRRILFCGAFAAVMALAVTTQASASTLTYTPVDPAFGGSPLNSSYLLGVAGAINKYKDPSATSSLDPGQLFVQQLQGQLLSALSTQITGVIFGPNAAQSGKIVFGDQTIAFVKGLDSVQLTITNTSTGSVTSIAIPTLQSTSTGTGGK
jgi:curli production assembly/transport component CsgF